MKPVGVLAFGLLFQHSLSTIPGVARQAPSATNAPSAPEFTLHSSSDLVLVDVTALRAKNSVPDTTLKRGDFQLFDNGRPVPVQVFDTGAQARPLTLWFVVQRSMRSYDAHGSGYFRGRIGLFKPALSTLAKQDTVAVAHWCDNGDSKLDLLPTSNVEEAATTLERVLAPTLDPHDHDRPGELALQKTLQLIVDATLPLRPEPLPVVLFLYADYSGMPKSEAAHFIDELLGTSAIAYGLKDRRSANMWFPLFDEQKEIAHYIARETGGQYLPVTPETYAAGLEQILRQLHLHSRYELGFKPDALDGKRHNLRVELADAVKKQHKGERLRYRAAYVALRRGRG